MKIEPRKKSDKGGYRMMPLKQNIPVPRDKNWKLSRCPACGTECWDRPLPEGFKENMFYGKLCTTCALREDKIGYLDGNKWMDNRHRTIENAIARKKKTGCIRTCAGKWRMREMIMR